MEFFVYFNDSQQGPFSREQLLSLPIMPDTPVWYAGLPDWTPAAMAPETAFLFNGSPREEPRPTPVIDQEDTQPPIVDVDAVPQSPQEETQSAQPGQQQIPQPNFVLQPRVMVDPSGAPKPKSFLGWAIVITLLCCMPFGIVAIIFASRVNERWQRGDFDGARRASDMAQMWIIISIVTGLVFSILYMLLWLPLMSVLG